MRHWQKVCLGKAQVYNFKYRITDFINGLRIPMKICKTSALEAYYYQLAISLLANNTCKPS